MHKGNILIRLIILFLLIHTSLYATPTNKETVKLENFQIFYINDEFSQLNIQDISQTKFWQKLPRQFALGYHLN